jgi:hypothetical protein
MVVIKNEHDDGCGTLSLFAILAALDKCKRPMLQCSAPVSLGMQVAHLLNLESSLHCNGLAVPFLRIKQ